MPKMLVADRVVTGGVDTHAGVHVASKWLGDIPYSPCGALCLDAAERDGALTIAPRLRLGDEDTDVPHQLQRMVRGRQRLEIPAAEQTRFRQEYYPRLRHLAPIVSTDESFTPPGISDPTLVLRAQYRTEHDLHLSWEWSYDIDEDRKRAPLQPDPTNALSYRDLAAERSVLASLDVPLERFGLRDEAPGGSGRDHDKLRTTELGGIEHNAVHHRATAAAHRPTKRRRRDQWRSR